MKRFLTCFLFIFIQNATFGDGFGPLWVAKFVKDRSDGKHLIQVYVDFDYLNSGTSENFNLFDQFQNKFIEINLRSQNLPAKGSYEQDHLIIECRNVLENEILKKATSYKIKDIKIKVLGPNEIWTIEENEKAGVFLFWLFVLICPTIDTLVLRKMLHFEIRTNKIPSIFSFFTFYPSLFAVIFVSNYFTLRGYYRSEILSTLNIMFGINPIDGAQIVLLFFLMILCKSFLIHLYSIFNISQDGYQYLRFALLPSLIGTILACASGFVLIKCYH